MTIIKPLSAGAIMVGLALNPVSAFQIISGSFDRNHLFQVQFEANANSYYVLYRGTNASDISTPINIAQGTGSVGQISESGMAGPVAFYRVQQIANSQMPVLTSLTPSSSSIPVGGTVTLTVHLDIPAPAGGTVATLCVNPVSAGWTPPSVVVPAGMTSVSFDYTDGHMVQSATVTATLGADMVQSVITITGGNALVINEIDYDNVGGSDANEFVEIFNTSSDAARLTNLALVFINGANNLEYLRVNLSGTLAGQGYLVVADSNLTVSTGATVVYFTNAVNNIQNGAPDGVALYDTAHNILVDSLSYEGPITQALINGAPSPVSLVEGTVLNPSVGDSNTTNGSLIRNPNGRDTDDADADWVFTTTPTPGTANVP